MNYNEALQKRYSVKEFDSEKKVSQSVLQNILNAGRLSASSLGLQPYRLIVVETDTVKNEMASVFANPRQALTCSHLLLIVTKKEIEPYYVDRYFEHIAKEREVEADSLLPFRNMVDYYLSKLSGENLSAWNEKQSYILLGHLIFAAALENVDSCPMEGFDAQALAQLIDLDTAKENVSVTLALGYRSQGDIFQHFKKVRKPEGELIKFL
ncbi:NAD(P)H-dependent oxidoreductase [Riemerella columbipharyngis]|uniref:Nitroreductase n=1 Tax=Riemerella columbipharyngis TaxID=1071918 RepID=A0A1G6YCY8_9FLAO|nr:NAD(P)H-dependent oxidoreductase [Riemerella columbipharyngis]SDD87597.1 Nitroreductase [Riemerella columbipharyngis]